ncbi:NapC/NirT family cytochrome c [Magnetospirillum sp. UT-4]|uniref:NapC/NirT family cytochrome c n=1 Tax=Magnetospirillum sp. UT-4 TaxID=2681467 RepID=UPI00137C7AEA|nr:NapC/NirT family cytochrome c [Magnetospirillum sp. UT-4]CAA7620502.1 nitrate reductase, cytochrome c-type,periplasmic [Magnetospirillum sp. UT-4]
MIRLSRPRTWLLGSSLLAAVVFFVTGIVFWGGFNTAMEATNTLGFCITCHEMKDTVYKEYTETVHFANRSGVRAVCADCHVPHPWVYKLQRKIQASGELYHKVMGTVDTPEKFEAKRVELAKRVWASMKATDSRECRNCHTLDAMSKDAQKATAWRQHSNAAAKGKTCIDCHKGIAHKDVSAFHEEEEPTDGN